MDRVISSIDWTAVRFVPNAPPAKPFIAEVQDVVASKKRLTRDDMRSPDRSRKRALPRQVAMYLAREMCGKSYPQIAAAFNRDHTTALHAFRKISKAASTNPELRAALAEYREAIIAQVEARATIQ